MNDWMTACPVEVAAKAAVALPTRKTPERSIIRAFFCKRKMSFMDLSFSLFDELGKVYTGYVAVWVTQAQVQGNPS
jgi:hypothetical protein